MAAVGALIGLPMFFEIGLVMLIPVILLVTRRSGLPLMQIGIPTLAGLSAMHGLVPPHQARSGSLFFSDVNDAGFWLVKEYFGMNVVQTLKSWWVMGTVVSVSGLVLVLALGVII